MAGAVGAAVANVEGAEAKGAAPASSEDPGPGENDGEELGEGEDSEEGFPEGAEEIGITQRPKGSVHLCQGEIFLAFTKEAKLIKANTPLLTIFRGTVNSANRNTEPHVPYTIDEKCMVLEGLHVDKLSKHISDGMTVWGKDIKERERLAQNGRRWPSHRLALASTGV